MGDRPLSARDMRQSVIVTGDGNTVMLTLRRQEHHLATIAGKLLPHLPRGSEPSGTACSPCSAYPRDGLSQFPIISRFRQINSRFSQIISRFRLTGI